VVATPPLTAGDPVADDPAAPLAADVPSPDNGDTAPLFRPQDADA
jgi:hypothetical protein